MQTMTTGNSETIIAHDDGTYTIMTTERYVPPSKGQQYTMLAIFGALLVLPLVPVGISVYEEISEARASRKARKSALKAV